MEMGRLAPHVLCMSMQKPYIGRFAPTPSGFLHFGSLTAALASFLDARAHQGTWLVRIEDTDPPREVPGASAAILKTLETYGLEWDGEVLYQSKRHDAYQAVIDQLLRQGLAYYCRCSRKQLSQLPVYPGTCRNALLGPDDAAVRIRVPELTYSFEDHLQGTFSQHLGRELGDFVIKRRDGYFAYQLAVVLDDALQGITDVVRGADLLDNTPRQLYLQELLGLPGVRYLHLPLIVQEDGHKLGKTYRSAPLPPTQVTPLLIKALRALGQPVADELLDASAPELLRWAIAHWDSQKIPKTLTLAEAKLA